jgi:hypothetical protein
MRAVVYRGVGGTKVREAFYMEQPRKFGKVLLAF